MRMDMVPFWKWCSGYTEATTMTKRMAAERMEYTEGYPAVKENGVTRRRGTIYYNCIGAVRVLDRWKRERA